MASAAGSLPRPLAKEPFGALPVHGRPTPAQSCENRAAWPSAAPISAGCTPDGVVRGLRAQPYRVHVRSSRIFGAVAGLGRYAHGRPVGRDGGGSGSRTRIRPPNPDGTAIRGPPAIGSATERLRPSARRRTVVVVARRPHPMGPTGRENRRRPPPTGPDRARPTKHSLNRA